MKNTARYSFLSRTFVILLACPLLLQAAPIPKLFNTGVDDSGLLLTNELVDAHYTITSSPDANFPGPDAFTLLPGFPVGPWIAEGTNSRWIAPQASQATGNEPGTYTYKTTFDLTGLDPATAQITGRLATDDGLGGVRLNGTDLTGITSAGFTSFTSFTIPIGSPFQTGINTLEFDISNGGTAPNPTGFRVEMSGRATGPNERPSVLSQPQSQTVVVGDLVTFVVEAAGTPPLTYQWRFNGSPVQSANQSSYTITGVKTNDAGNYSVSISNAAGQTNSADAILTVLIPFPGIYNTGVDSNRVVLADSLVDGHYKLILNANDTNSTDALAQGTIPSPPWIPNTNKSRWIGPLTDATAAPGNYTYQLHLDLTGYDPATAFLAGSWAADDNGSLFLNGADTSFRSTSFTAFSEFSLTNGFVSGTNVLEFRIANGGTADNPTGLRVENLRGTANQGTVNQSPPKIVTQPQAATRVITENVTFTVVADGTAPFTYQWFQNSGPLSGKTNGSLTIDPITVSDGGDYTVRVSNGLGSTNSAIAQLVVIQPELGLFNTGVDSAGVVLPIGQIDPHYVVISSPDSAYPGPTVFVTEGAIPPWVSNDENSAWIAPRADNSAQTAPGSYRYRLIFTVEGSEVATAAITGNVGTDDGNGGLFLNGTRIDGFPTGTGFGALTALDIPAGSPFVTGVNTLDFVIVNGGAAANPTGLRVDDLIITGVTQRPNLTVARVGNNVRLAWPASATGFTLQETISLPGVWVNSADQGTVQGAEKVVTFPLSGPSKFYRLRQ